MPFALPIAIDFSFLLQICVNSLVARASWTNVKHDGVWVCVMINASILNKPKAFVGDSFHISSARALQSMCYTYKTLTHNAAHHTCTH